MVLEMRRALLSSLGAARKSLIQSTNSQPVGMQLLRSDLVVRMSELSRH